MALSLKGSWICSPEQIGGYDVLTNVSFHVETVCLLSKLHEAKHHVNVRFDMDEMDLTAAERR